MTWPLKILMLPVIAVLHLVLLVMFAGACAAAVWEWFWSKKC